jgi:hypothetical protein
MTDDSLVERKREQRRKLPRFLYGLVMDRDTALGRRE